MKAKLRALLQQKRAQIIIGLVAATLPYLDVLFYVPHGLLQEYYANSTYLQLIERFPASLTPRTEPFFVLAAWALKNSTGWDSTLILAILKNAITILHIVFFYLIIEILTKRKSIAVLSTILYACSLPFFLLFANLLRNFFGNALLLVTVYCWLKIITEKRNQLIYLAVAGVTFGALIYAHLLPAVILAATFFLHTLVLALYQCIAYYRGKSAEFPATQLRSLALALAVATIVGLPYIASLVQSQISVADYRQALSQATVSTIHPAMSLPSVKVSCAIAEHAFIAKAIATQQAPKPQLAAFSILPAAIRKSTVLMLRFLFEYRDIALPLSLMPVIAWGIPYLYLIVGRPLPQHLLLVVLLWLVTYAGTKLDFFGIGVLPFRFTLMLTIPSLLGFSIVLNEIWSAISQANTKAALYIAIVAVWLGHNVPPILEASVLRTLDSRLQEQSNLQQFLISHAQIPQPLKNIIELPQLQTTDAAQAYETAKKQEIAYLFLDDSQTLIPGSDINTATYPNLCAFFDRRYFTTVAKIVNPFSEFYIIRTNDKPNLITTKKDKNVRLINLDTNARNVDISLPEDIKPKNWDVVAHVREGRSILYERIITDDADYVLYYEQPTRFIVHRRSLFSHSVDITVPGLAVRQRADTVSLKLYLTDGVLLTKASPPVLARDLTQLGNNQLRTVSKLSANQAHIVYLDRLQFKLAVRVVLFAITLMLVAPSLVQVAQTRHYGAHVSPRSRSSVERVVMGGVVVLLVDLLFGAYFIELYKEHILSI